MSTAWYGLRVAGYGVTNSDYGGDVAPTTIATTPDHTTLQTRFCTFLPASDPNGMVCSARLAALPSELESAFDPHEATSVISGATFGLLATGEVSAAFMRPRARVAAKLTTSVSAATTSLTFDDGGAGLEGLYLWLGQECIYAHTNTAPGVYSCERGALGTQAQAHVADALHDTAAFVAGHGHNVVGRLVELVTCDGSDDTELLGDLERVIWRGVVRSVGYDPARQAVELECGSLLALVREGRVCRNPWRGRLRNRPTPGRYATLDAPDPGYYDPVEAGRSPLFSGAVGGLSAASLFSDGEAVFYGTPRTSGTGEAVSAPLAPSGLTAPYPGSEPRERLEAEIHEVYGVGDRAPGSLPANAVELVRHLLTATDDTGLGLPTAYLDGDTFDRLAAIYGDALAQERYVLGIDGPVDVWPLISVLLRPACMALGQRPGGLLTLLTYAEVLPLQAGQTLDDDAVRLDSPAVQQTPMAVAPTARIDVEYASRVGAKARALVVEAPQARDRYPVGMVSATELRLPGIADSPRARRLAVGLASVLRAPIPGITVDAMPDVDLAPGDVVRVTLKDVVDADGGRNGCVAEPMLTVSRAFDLDGFRARYKLLRHTLGQRRGAWNLAARVTAWDGGAEEATIHATEFLGPASAGGWSAVWEPWFAALGLIGTVGVVGLLVDLLDETLAKQGTATLELAGPHYLVLTSATASPSAGWVVVPSDYDAADGLDDAAIFPYFAYLADDNDTLGSTAEDAYLWSV